MSEEARRPRIAVVDYGAGNLVSIEQALTSVGRDGDRGARRRRRSPLPMPSIVPGVGAAAPAMERLERRGLVEPIRAWIAADRPFLGICLGLQLLFEGSDEDGATTLGVLPGRTSRLVDAPTLPAHRLEPGRSAPASTPCSMASPMARTCISSTRTRACPRRRPRTRSSPGPSTGVRSCPRSPWAGCSGVQFHPERSGTDGLRLLANFVGLVRAGAAAPAEVAA